MTWERTDVGFYRKNDGAIDAVVRQDAEIWRSYVYFEGCEVDRGEWDGRGVALRNANAAIRRALALRAPIKTSQKQDDEDDDDD